MSDIFLCPLREAGVSDLKEAGVSDLKEAGVSDVFTPRRARDQECLM